MKIKYITILFCMWLLPNKSKAQDTAWVRANTWYFTNFKDSYINWDLFAQTFIGVSPTRSTDGTYYERVMFDNLYKPKLFPPGSCYGMDVLALEIYKNGGSMGYCQPTYIYPGDITAGGGPKGPVDSVLKRAIELTHGNQINNGFLSFLLDVIATGNNRNGQYAVQQIKYYLAHNDPPILCISSNLFLKEGHVVVPYRVDPDGSGGYKIYVYNPNYSFYDTVSNYKNYYNNQFNVVTVTQGGNWTFEMDTSEMDTSRIWSGSPGGGGNCIAVPLSIAGHKDRLPQSLIADVNEAISTILIFGNNIAIKQIHDPENKRHYFNDDGTDTEPDTSQCMNNIMPFIPFTGKPDTNNSLVYFLRGDKPVDFDIKAAGDYRVITMFDGKFTEREYTGNGTLQTIRMGGESVVANVYH